jgi:hypothetical protein
MKIRMKGNAVRYRLSKSDLKNLELNLTIEERTNFGEATLTYQLVPSAAYQQLDAALNNNCIKIFIPEHFSKVWNSNELVSITAVKGLRDGNQLHLLVEKDFQCLDKTSEDQSDFFINPNTSCK